MDDTILAPSHCNHLPCFNTVPTTMVIQEVTRPINRETGHKGFASRDPNFEDLIGNNATLRLLLREPSGRALFHEAGIYLPGSQSVFISSNRLPCARGRQHGLVVRVPVDKIPEPMWTTAKKPSIIEPLEGNAEAEQLWQNLDVMDDLPEELSMPNGATPWAGRNGQEGILWCAQGHHDLDGDGSANVDSALVCMSVDDSGRPTETEVVLDLFRGKKFSSLNDVVVHQQSGCVFFTDPDYGVGQSFKRTSDYAPNALYAWHPETGEVRLIDDRYHMPNGVTFVPDPREPHSGKGLLVTTDTGRFTFEANDSMGVLQIDERKPASIYTYPVEPSRHPDLDPLPVIKVHERRLLWESESGVPDGIHPDERGNVWVGHGDGVHVYNPFTRRLLGKVILPGGKGVANFCWAGRAGKDAITGKDMYRMLLFAEDELWEACVAVNGCD